MSYDLPGSDNPFAPPRAPIGMGVPGLGLGGDTTQSEIIRRAHLGREASVRSIGLLNYLGTFFLIIAGGGMVMGAVSMANNPALNLPDVPPQMTQAFLVGVGAFYLAFGIFFGFLGYGLRKLKPWARWAEIVVTSLSLLYNIYGGIVAGAMSPGLGIGILIGSSLIPGFILYLLLSSKANMVFSPEYKTIIAQTPHVKYKTSIIVKIALGLLVALLVFIVVALFIGGVNR